jgi:hypothetical protein
LAVDEPFNEPAQRIVVRVEEGLKRALVAVADPCDARSVLIEQG